MNEQQDAAAVQVFPPAVPLLTILIGIGINHLWPIDVEFPFPKIWRYSVGGAIIAGALFCLGLWSVVLFRQSGQSENPWKPTPQLVDRGPFRITRNPMYLQMILICVGIAVILGNVWILIMTPFSAWALQRFAILPEEVYLERKFGAQYLAYKHRVRRWL
jgi:protein-S-isoprenylcysteine O-methyltransferase Ste14